MRLPIFGLALSAVALIYRDDLLKILILQCTILSFPLRTAATLVKDGNYMFQEQYKLILPIQFYSCIAMLRYISSVSYENFVWMYTSFHYMLYFAPNSCCPCCFKINKRNNVKRHWKF